MASKRGQKFKHMARAGMLPFAMLLWCSWLCLDYLEGASTLYREISLLFRSDVIVTAAHAFVVLFVYRSR